MSRDKIWLSSPHMGENELKYVKEAFDSNWIAPLGPNVDLFEEAICNYTGSVACAALSSGSAAIHLSLIMLNVGLDDEVLCQSFTFSATANPIRYVGATPVFIDSEKGSWNMDPGLLEQAILDSIDKGKKPKAILLVHLYGMPARMDEINAIAAKYEIPIIEDAAEALGSKYDGKAAGTLTDYGVYSFNGNKIITTSGGGALVSPYDKICDKATFLATQARDAAPHYQHSEIGYNYRMSNIVAGIGRGQMEVLDNRVASRRANFEFYKEEFSKFEGISFQEEGDKSFSNRWLTCILTDSFEIREEIRLALQEQNIEARPLWKPMHLQPVFNNFPKYLNGVSEDYFNRGLCLPSGSNLKSEDLNAVAEIVKTILHKNQ